jgi:hypothetical protein
MTVEEEISEVKAELDEAQQGLRETLTEASAKAEQQEGALRPDRLIKSHPVGASCLAGALGFVIGSKARSSAVGSGVMVALLGYAIFKCLSDYGSNGDGRDTSS